GEGLTLYRELSAAGKSVCRVNGTLVSGGELKELGDLLVDLHGQHQHQSLLRAKTHLTLLDAFAKSNADGLIDQLKAERQTALAAKTALERIQSDSALRERRLDMLRYQAQEIAAAGLTDGEEEDLLEVRARMQNAQAIVEGLHGAYDALYGEQGALPKLSDATRALTPIAAFHADYAAASECVGEAYYNLEDVARDLRGAIDEFRYDPTLQEETENRLMQIAQLKRKYGANIKEILAYWEEADREIQLLDDSEGNQVQLQAELNRAKAAYLVRAQKLSDRRKAAAAQLEKEIVRELQELGMPHAKFRVAFAPISPEILAENGLDEVEFLLSANLGESEKPLIKVASGGEISRIMLAFKVALRGADAIPTLIFDEIDAGISGLIANTVARKMRALSHSHQILCVTHLPQIAALANAHYQVIKEEQGGHTRSFVRQLAETERIIELARIMGGQAHDAAALEHAKEMLDHA
ncbi:MAG: DNA repair protein RecN, partial [Clostridiales bacterium]|nr:DNA repair protein RecN [Clostridiales bacterium]